MEIEHAETFWTVSTGAVKVHPVFAHMLNEKSAMNTELPTINAVFDKEIFLSKNIDELKEMGLVNSRE